MTADGELYCNEVCRDEFGDEITKALGHDEWRIDSSMYSDCWDTSTLPDIMQLPIKHEDTDEVLGDVIITNEFVIEDDGHCRWVEARPKSCEVVVK